MLMQWKTTSDPFFNDFRVLSRQFDEVFRDLLPTPKTRTTGRRFSVEESEDAFTLQASLPGLVAEDLSLEVADGKLTVSANRSTHPPEGYKAIRRERGTLSVARTFSLGPKVDVDGVQAKLEDGVLTITLPKRAEQKPRQIAVSAA